MYAAVQMHAEIQMHVKKGRDLAKVKAESLFKI